MTDALELAEDSCSGDESQWWDATAHAENDMGQLTVSVLCVYSVHRASDRA